MVKDKKITVPVHIDQVPMLRALANFATSMADMHQANAEAAYRSADKLRAQADEIERERDGS